jgi:hypothetical protein
MTTITEARITPLPSSIFQPMPIVYATIEGKEQRLFEYYPDEISFTEAEFIGLTLHEAHQLFFNKDKAYLQS